MINRLIIYYFCDIYILTNYDNTPILLDNQYPLGFIVKISKQNLKHKCLAFKNLYTKYLILKDLPLLFLHSHLGFLFPFLACRSLKNLSPDSRARGGVPLHFPWKSKARVRDWNVNFFHLLSCIFYCRAIQHPSRNSKGVTIIS